jgi:predicted porin
LSQFPQFKEFVMQKKIIALAVAGLMSGAAFAQSNVIVYGSVDASYKATSTDAAAGAADKTTGIDDSVWSSSRIGFKGEEDLGNGLKALFQLEYAINSDENAGIGSGTGATSARTQIVGLSSATMGTVVAGRMNTPGKNVHDKYDVMGGSNLFSASQTLNGSLTTGALTTGAGSSMNARLNNTVAYVSPVVAGGLTATVAYSFSGAAGDDSVAYGNSTAGAADDDQERIVAMSLDYSTGPFGIAYAYHGVSDLDTPTGLATYNDVSEHLIAGSYDFGVVKLAASYMKTGLDGRLAATSDVDNKVWSVGAIVPLGGGNLRLTYADLSVDDNTTADRDADQWSIAYTYDLSKRTMIYAGYTDLSNGNAAVNKVNGGATPVAGGDSNGYAFGINHKF